LTAVLPLPVAALLLACLLAQQVLSVELGGSAGTSILLLPLLALAVLLWKTVPLVLAKRSQ